MKINDEHRKKNLLKVLCPALLLIACVLKTAPDVYARYAATFYAPLDISLDVKPGTYTVILHQGGAGEETEDTTSYEFTYKPGEQVTLPEVEEFFSKTGHTGTGWNTSATGTGTKYPNGCTSSNLVGAGQTLHLYAMWTPNMYSISYDANEGSGAPASESAYYGTVHTLSSVIPIRKDYVFLGWYTRKEGGERVESIEVSGDVTVYANWKLDTVTITYMPNLLPRGYTQVEWLRGDGASYITTDVSLSGDSRVRVVYEASENAEQTAGFIGVGGTGGFYASFAEGQLSLNYGEFSDETYVGDRYTVSPCVLTQDASGKHELYANRHVWRIDGETAAMFVYEPFDTGCSAYVFGANGMTSYFDGKIYAAQFADNSGIVSSLVPAVNGAGEPGLYDIKKKSFYSKYGDGEFAVGPELTDESEAVMRGNKIKVLEDAFDDIGCHLSHWNTMADGSGEDVAPGAELTLQGDITLYAVWEEAVPVLKSGHLWYDSDKAGDESTYTKIRITDEIDDQKAASADAVWYADAAGEGHITCYRFGTELWIAGNGTGYIQMASDPKEMFAGFCSVTEIEGLDLLDTGGCETLERLFCSPTSSTWDDMDILTGGIGEGTKDDGCMTALPEIYGIEAWDTSKVKSIKGMCYGLSGLESIADISYWDMSAVTSVELAFAGCESLESADLNEWDTSAVTNIRGLFCGCESLSRPKVGRWDTSAVKDASYAFYGAGSAQTTSVIDLTGWDADGITNMVHMFDGCTSVRTIYVSDEWSVAADTADSYMFSGCGSLVGALGTTYDAAYIGREYAHIDVEDDPGYLTRAEAKVVSAGSTLAFTYSGAEYAVSDRYKKSLIDGVYDVPTDISAAADVPWYASAESYKKVEVERCFHAVKPVTMAHWFNGQKYVAEYEGLEYIDTSDVASLEYTFKNAGYKSASFDMDLGGWDVSNVTTFKGMFYETGGSSKEWNAGDLGRWDTSSAVTMSAMFHSAGKFCKVWNPGDIGSWDVSHVTSFKNMFANVGLMGSALNLDLSRWVTSSATDMYGMFYYSGSTAKTWSVGNLKDWDVSKVTDMTDMFNGAGLMCKAWSIGDVSGWNTSNVTKMFATFESAGQSSEAFELDVSGWDTAKVTNMGYMFSAAGYVATTLTLKGYENFNVSKVTNMNAMFQRVGTGVPDFVLDLSAWSTPKLSTTMYMFDGMTTLKTIYVGEGWKVKKSGISLYMFNNCKSLVGGNGTVYDSSHIDVTYARVDAEGTPGYLTAKTAVSEAAVASVDAANVAVLSAAASEDVQQLYIETLLAYEDSIYDASSGAFTPGTSSVTGISYSSEDEWVTSREYISWKERCEYLKSLLEGGI